jgi:agmatine deiminase
MPAEWEHQAAMLLAWPHNRNDWPGKYDPIPWVYGEIVRHLARFQTVRILVNDDTHRQKAEGVLNLNHADLARVQFITCPTNRVWVRDSGPISVVNGKGEHALVQWKFNAWAKYKNYQKDAGVTPALTESLKLPVFQPHLTVAGKRRHVVLEGGSIDVNGQGVLLTTEECLLSDIQCRNPGMTREQYEQLFHDYLGITHTVWLGNGIVGDDTHGHVDDLARFVSPDTVVTVVEHNLKDSNYQPLQENLKRLKQARDAKGKPLNVVELPMPKPLMFEDTQLPASYANFLIANGLVIVPTFNDANDRVALNLLAELFPKHEVVGIHAVDLVWGFGTLHCLSQQMSA